jgi:hypothetical protein
MKAVVFENLEDFNAFESILHQAMKESVENYIAEKWAEPIYSLDKTLIACPIETDGLRGEICLQNSIGLEIISIDYTDPVWFE